MLPVAFEFAPRSTAEENHMRENDAGNPGILDHNKFLACQPFEKRPLIFREALLLVLACAAPYTLTRLTSHLELPNYG